MAVGGQKKYRGAGTTGTQKIKKLFRYFVNPMQIFQGEYDWAPMTAANTKLSQDTESVGLGRVRAFPGTRIIVRLDSKKAKKKHGVCVRGHADSGNGRPYLLR